MHKCVPVKLVDKAQPLIMITMVVYHDEMLIFSVLACRVCGRHFATYPQNHTYAGCNIGFKASQGLVQLAVFRRIHLELAKGKVVMLHAAL